MTLIADESVDFGLINELQSKGFTVISILEEFAGIKDPDVLKISMENECLLITEDKDFGELIYRSKFKHHGILLIRLFDMPRKERIRFIADLIESYFTKLQNNFSVITRKGLRIKTVKN